MNSLVLLIVCVAILIAGYIFYGGWLCKQWGVGDSKTETPAHTMEDGVDYVPAKAPVLMGHHFSSIAGAGPITGPIGAAMFGWLPVTLWILVGGIFFGGVHDFGALFASVRNKGQSIGEIISSNMSKRAKQLFIIFSYLTLILVVAAFASIVASTFGAVYDETGALNMAASETPATVAMISILFIVIAIVFGFCVYRRNMPMGIASVVGVLAIVLIMVVGMNFHPIYLSTKTWMRIVGIYIAIASVTPVWILLQPRDYLSSFLLYAMLIVAFFGVVVAHPTFDSTFPAVTSFAVDNGNGVQYMFPVLFTTVACGAISGFHSLVSSGTASKQIKNEKNMLPVSFGAMLMESMLAIIALIAVASFADGEAAAQGLTTQPQIFAGAIANFLSVVGLPHSLVFTLINLAVSAFALTSLDSVARVGRLSFQEFFMDSDTDEENMSPFLKVVTNKYFATIITLVLAYLLTKVGYAEIWPLFGSANQLLSVLALVACAVFLKKTKRQGWMLWVPMLFMMAVTFTALSMTIIKLTNAFMTTGLDLGNTLQLVFAVLLLILGVLVAIQGIKKLLEKADK